MRKAMQKHVSRHAAKLKASLTEREKCFMAVSELNKKEAGEQPQIFHMVGHRRLELRTN